MKLSLSVLLGVAAAAFVLSPSASAQSVWGVNGPGTLAMDTAGPPVGPCSYPKGPLIGGFNYTVPFGCPIAGPFPPPFVAAMAVGDIAIDRVLDRVWITDGATITGYTKGGAAFASIPNPLPAPLTGLGWGVNPLGPAGSALWITDGTFAAALATPAIGCGALPFAIAPFLVTFPGLATDIDYDPLSGTLFMSNLNGAVSNQTIFGGFGPFGVFVPAVPCGALGPLVGLAIDTASCKSMFVTNGGAMARVDFFGAPAPVTFYAPLPCWPWGGAATSGLAFDATPIHYAKGCNPTGPVPTIDTIQEALTPNPGFGITLSGAVPGGGAFLLLGVAPACPMVPVGFGCVIAEFPLAALVGPIPVPATGNVGLPAPIPPGLGCSGLAAYVQWLVAKPAGGLETTDALHIQPALP